MNIFFCYAIFYNIFSYNILPSNDYTFDNILPCSNEPTNPYKNGEMLISLELINDGDIVFDVGANIGEFSQGMVTKKNLNVFLFEPLPFTFNMLLKNLSKKLNFELQNFNINYIFDLERNSNYYFVNHGLSSFNGESEFYSYESLEWASSLSSMFHNPSYDAFAKINPSIFKIKIQTLDDFCKNNNIEKIDYLKIDVEGGDFEVILGASEMIKNKKIKYIQFEYVLSWSFANRKLKDAYNFFDKAGYKLYKIFPQGLFPIDGWRENLENYTYSNYIAILE